MTVAYRQDEDTEWPKLCRCVVKQHSSFYHQDGYNDVELNLSNKCPMYMAYRVAMKPLLLSNSTSSYWIEDSQVFIHAVHRPDIQPSSWHKKKVSRPRVRSLRNSVLRDDLRV